MKNPNAAAAGGMTAVALAVYQGMKALGVDLSPDEAILYGGSVISAVLFIGRNGLRGLARILWRGRDTI